MNPVSLIRKKRDGGTLRRDELHRFITDYVSGKIPDYQMSAFLMAVYFKGMSSEEQATLTDVMLHSGKVIDLSAIPGVKVDKHSTGGVGDKVSLILAPMVAACGVPVPMISGRGLGHTGGTLDKLESIPGFTTTLSIDEYKRIVAETGLVLIGQTSEIAPADKMMYALRDVTATVESVPLIAGSIMSKKLAEGIDALVLDVKTGNGAFMQTYDDAVSLARALVAVGLNAGKNTVGFITDMSQPLGSMVGNWLEVKESIACLRGRDVRDLMEVTCVLGGAMVYLGGKSASIEEGMKLCRAAIWSGKAYEKFVEIVGRQGGDVSFVHQPEKYPVCRHEREVLCGRNGFVQGFDTRRVGALASGLGAGRSSLTDLIDPKAGIAFWKKIGDRAEEKEPLAVFWTDREGVVDHTARELASCIHITEKEVSPPRPVHAFVDGHGLKPWVMPQLF
jgi:pyrimidine-nucleoside phosphorylase